MLISFLGKEYFGRNYEKGCACFGGLSKWPKGNLGQRLILARTLIKVKILYHQVLETRGMELLPGEFLF